MDRPAPASPTLAAAIAGMLKDRGVKRIFGIPGGGSSLALMEAAGRAGLDFVLTRTETAGAIMAAVTGEMTGAPGVMLTGVGPGAASAVNGVAYAHLEKAPLVLFTDGPAPTPHQAIDQNALYRPVTKLQGRVHRDGAAAFAQALETAMTPPCGPVQLDLSAGDATSPLSGDAPEPAPPSTPPEPSADSLEKARALLAQSERPVIVAGLEARGSKGPVALRRLADALGCPVLASYKASGVLPASHPGFTGLFTGAVAEAGLLHEADLIVLFGLDPIEIVPGRWDYAAPVLDLCAAEAGPLPITPACRVLGALDAIADALAPELKASAWTRDGIATARRDITEKLALEGGGNTAETVTAEAAALAPPGTRLTVDAGAHMFSALTLWPAEAPFGVLKSNGLSTMGYALPAAIASALEEPDRPVLAVTGDGGLMMCLAELTTAVERGCDITVAVINDASLSLIDIKQQRLQYETRGVRYPGVDFAASAEALGCRGWRVAGGAAVSTALREAFATKGPALVDVMCNPDGYGGQLVRLRG